MITISFHAHRFFFSSYTFSTGNCVTAGLLDDLTKASDSKVELVKHRDRLAERLRNYTCADPTLETSTPLDSKTVHFENISYRASTYLDMSNAKIWTVGIYEII